MVDVKSLKRVDVLEEMRHIANNYLTNHGPLTGLQMELNHDGYIDSMYLREKIHLIKMAMDGLEHDLNILERDV